MLPISNRLFSFTSQSGIHVFQSILSKQPRLNFIPFISVLLLLLFCRSQGQSRRKVESLCFCFYSADTCTHRGHRFLISAKTRWPRIVDDVGPWELKIRKSKMARGRQCRRHGWFFSRFSSLLQG